MLRMDSFSCLFSFSAKVIWVVTVLTGFSRQPFLCAVFDPFFQTIFQLLKLLLQRLDYSAILPLSVDKFLFIVSLLSGLLVRSPSVSLDELQ
uniref:Uncharacterized protein n=1 Tax=Anguilla anguilla TaxID=7936 RepID=A0A0E9VZS7_ANGAN